MFQLAHCIAISFVLTTALSDGNLEFLANLTELNPPTNITVINRELGELTFAWNDNLSEDMKRRIDVRYLFEYKYFDSHDWEHYRIQHTENEDTFELHRGVSVRVKNVLLDRKQVTVKESNWTVEEIEPSGDPETLISNFSCIVYNHSSMNCTWRKGRKAPTDTQYTMYYSQNKNTRQCTQYFMDVCGMQGCHVDHIDIEEILICVKGSSNSRTIRPYYTKIDPTSCVTYSPPVNLKVLQNLTVKWDMPPDEDYYNDFFEFELNVSGLDVPLITVDEPNYVFVNINPTKRYSVKVRMRSKYCKKAKIWNNWSNWSNEDFIEPTQSFNSFWVLIILAIIVTLALLLLLFAFKRCKVLETVFKPIPDPRKKFKTLFEEYNGDFQNWINYQIPISKADECHPVVIEESPKAEA